jgi:hypothetical protein
LFGDSFYYFIPYVPVTESLKTGNSGGKRVNATKAAASSISKPNAITLIHSCQSKVGWKFRRQSEALVIGGAFGVSNDISDLSPQAQVFLDRF